MGRRLESAVKSDGTAIAYTYNADGLRTSKTIGDTKYNYYWNGDKLTAQTWGENTLYFRYDGETPIGFEYNDSQYYYVTNLQGDIIAILNSSGTCVAEYSYDAWGNCTIVSDTEGIGEINPLRYRGYYFDSDTDMYYLQSRYYDAGIGRFVNADSAEMIMFDDENLFSYTSNNYIMYNDIYGTAGQTLKPAPTAPDLNVVVWAIKSSGLYDRRYATVNYFTGKRKDKKSNSTIYAFTSNRKTHFYKSEYYVRCKTRKQWYKYIKVEYGRLKSINEFFKKMEQQLGDPIWDTEPSVSDLASALNKVAKVLNWATLPREANYIISMIHKYDKKYGAKQKNIYIPGSAHVMDCYWGKKYVFWGKKVVKYSYNKWECAW